MLRRMYEAGQDKKLKNKWATKVGEIAKILQEIRLRLYGHHVMRRDELYVGRRVMVMKYRGERREEDFRDDGWTE